MITYSEMVKAPMRFLLRSVPPSLRPSVRPVRPCSASLRPSVLYASAPSLPIFKDKKIHGYLVFLELMLEKSFLDRVWIGRHPSQDKSPKDGGK